LLGSPYKHWKHAFRLYLRVLELVKKIASREIFCPCEQAYGQLATTKQLSDDGKQQMRVWFYLN